MVGNPKDRFSRHRVSFSFCIVLFGTLNFLVIVKAAPYECVIRVGQP